MKIDFITSRFFCYIPRSSGIQGARTVKFLYYHRILPIVCCLYSLFIREFDAESIGKRR